MVIHWTEDERLALRKALDGCEWAECTETDEYVVDLYDVEPPLSLQLSFAEKKLDVLAAETMTYDDAMDGWYLSGPQGDMSAIEAALRTLL